VRNRPAAMSRSRSGCVAAMILGGASPGDLFFEIVSHPPARRNDNSAASDRPTPGPTDARAAGLPRPPDASPPRRGPGAHVGAMPSMSPNQNQGLAAQRSSIMWPLTRMMATRTRPKSLSASRRKRRPGLECLEEKQLLSITFGAYGNGTYAFNSGGAGFRQIDTAVPTAMREGADGTLFAVYDNGTYRYDYGSNHWSLLTSGKASALSAARDNTLFGSFSDGTYEFNGSWHRLTTAVATDLAAVSNNNVYASYSDGTWQ